MSTIYDNWERLVAAVLKREEIWQLCHQSSTSTSFRSKSSDSSSSFRLSDRNYLDNSEESVVETIPEIVFNGRFPLKFGADGAKELGRGRFGTSILHKLRKDVRVSDNGVLAKGTELVIKLLNNVKVTKDEFKQQMIFFGSCRHENVAAPRAYYFSNKAHGKLIFYDYHSQGSVSNMLHGARLFSWQSRLKIAIGAARGIAHIHRQCGEKPVAHGNIKSSNIFLNSHQYGCVSDFSLEGIMVKPPTRGALGYHASEYESKNASQESDVYSFGILLLELLTGKSPMRAYGYWKNMHLVAWVRSIEPHEWDYKLFDQSLTELIIDEVEMVETVEREIPGTKDSAMDLGELRVILRSHFDLMAIEMVEMLRVAMSCLAMIPEDRPKMSDVALMLENVARSRFEIMRQHTNNSYQPDEKEGVWNRIFRLGRS